MVKDQILRYPSFEGFSFRHVKARGLNGGGPLHLANRHGFAANSTTHPCDDVFETYETRMDMPALAEPNVLDG